MIRLSALIEGIAGARVVGDPETVVREVRDDSRQVQAGDLFVAVPGTKQDGRRYIDEAIGKGAAAVLTDEGAVPDGRAAWVLVPSVRQALGMVAASRFGAAAAMRLTAVTGTSGKTTMTYLMESILRAAGRAPAVVGTVTYRYPGYERPASLTTPGALELHAFLAQAREAGCADAVMEASSQALHMGRLAGCRFRAAALTNVTQDHLDYHRDWDSYFHAKGILFRELMAPDGVAVLFADREDGRRMRNEARGPVLTVALDAGAAADVVVQDRRLEGDGTRATLATPAGPIAVRSALVGEFNLANVALAIGIAVALELPGEAIAAGVEALGGVPGRLEKVANHADVLCMVDYAHKPDALERGLEVLRPLTRGRLIVVFGCGGDRDQSKRAVMGELAARHADVVVVTSDNPRTEKPEAIIDMILAGVSRTGLPTRTAEMLATGAHGLLVEPERRRAIRQAARIARPGDTVLIAGKGHEDYQILGTTKIHFDDREEARAAFAPEGRS